MLEKNEKIYLIILVMSVIILIFMSVYIRNKCSRCDETYNKKSNQPIIVYKL